MPGPVTTPFVGDTTLPRAVDVVVIGAGVIGAFTALELAERGHRVLLCDKGDVGGEQSSRNWGWVRIGMRDMREVPLMAEAIRLWQDMDRRLEAKSGYVRAGITFACETEEAEASHEGWLRSFRDGGFAEDAETGPGIEMIGREGLRSVYPGLGSRARAALHARIDGRAEPQWVAPAVAEAARRKGAGVVTGCAVLAVEWQAGRVSGVVTERGPVACQSVVLAGGIWSSGFARMEGVDLPQLRVLNSVMRTSPLENGPDGALWTSQYAFRRRADGGYSIASAAENIIEIVPDSFRYLSQFSQVLKQEWRSLRPRLSRSMADDWMAMPRGAAGMRGLLRKYRIFDPTPATPTVERAFEALKREYPVFEPLKVLQTWGGMIDVTPDAVPVISRVEGRDGLVIATGFSGHGFGISPGAGKLAADLVSGDVPVVNPFELRLCRFHDGSPIRVMGGV